MAGYEKADKVNPLSPLLGKNSHYCLEARLKHGVPSYCKDPLFLHLTAVARFYPSLTLQTAVSTCLTPSEVSL